MPTTIGNPSQAYSYKYDLVGNRSQEQIDNSVTASTLNNLNQITSQGPGGTMSFTGTVSEPGTLTVGGNAGSMDALGAWTASATVSVGANALPLVATDLNGNVANKTIDVTVIGGSSRTLTYDSNGNLLNNGAGQTYAWDAENRLVSITQTSGTTGFVYNGFGQRVQETLAGTVIKEWVWGSGPQPLEERNSSGGVTKRFYGSLGEQISGTNYYFTTDHLGSIREMVNSSGINQARYSYDPFGRRTLVSGTDLADFGFTGDYYHAATGLSLTEFRAYDPNVGRWLNADPIGLEGGLNLFAYVGNNPIGLVDPSGLDGLSLQQQLIQAQAISNSAAGIIQRAGGNVPVSTKELSQYSADVTIAGVTAYTAAHYLQPYSQGGQLGTTVSRGDMIAEAFEGLGSTLAVAGSFAQGYSLGQAIINHDTNGIEFGSANIGTSITAAAFGATGVGAILLIGQVVINSAVIADQIATINEENAADIQSATVIYNSAQFKILELTLELQMYQQSPLPTIVYHNCP
jgi:RHS repeat-associated protein